MPTTAAETLTSGNPAPAGESAGGLPTAAPTGWWDTVKDAETKTWLGSKNFPDAEHALVSHRNLEKLMGADRAGRTVMLPKDDGDAEGWASLAKRIGVPDSADGYKLPLPEGTDDGFSKAAAEAFRQAGVPPRGANKIAEWWNGWVAEQVKNGEAADKAESDKQMSALKGEWGTAFDANRELAQRGFREFSKQFGLDDKAALERAESVLGAANLTKLFMGLGRLNAESNFAGGDSARGFGLSKAEAQKEVDQINADRISGKINDLQWRTVAEKRKIELGQILSA